VKFVLTFLFSIYLFSPFLHAYDSMHEKTPVGDIKILDLPERLALEASSTGSYFQENNGLFRKLFRFISTNDVSMTTPVEADIKPGKMRFFVGNKDKDKLLQSNKSVQVSRIPPKKVLSIGVRGGYSEENFNKKRLKLITWLANNKKFVQDGPAYGVYWNGPFVPGFFKRSEVHIPIRIRSTKTQKNTK
jgi:DNA gyrase inhibitor GyrI